MIYLVSRNQELFKSNKYEMLSPEDAIKKLSGESILGCDTETTGLNPITKKILTIQLGNEDYQIVWDCTSYPLIRLKDLLESPNILFIWHNYAFDSMFLLKEGIVQKNFFDTMIGERVLNNGKDRKDYSTSLKACALKYCDYDMDKSARGEIITSGLTERTIVYSGTDVKYSIPIYRKQQEELIKYHVKKAADFESKFTIVVGYIKLCGVKLDIDKWKEKMRKDSLKMNKYLDLLNKWIVDFYHKNKTDKNTINVKILVDAQFVHPGDNTDLVFMDPNKLAFNFSTYTYENKDDPKYGFLTYLKGDVPFGYYNKAGKFFPFIEYVTAIQQDLFNPVNTTFGDKSVVNWSSSSQLIPLFEMLGFNLYTLDKVTKEYRKSVDAKVIKPQRDICSELVDAYIGYKEAAKVCTAFGENFLKVVTKEDGRIHADFHPIGADTFRMSCGGDNSVNLQQLPSDAETRACFVSEKGNKWISVDYKS